MRIQLVIGILICLSCFCSCQNDGSQTTFIMVRHAEKSNDHPDDPNLSEVGVERAKRLADIFHYAEIDAVLSTNYKRTRNTVKPLAEKKNLKVISYDAFEQGLIETLAKRYPHQTILLSGHSNSVPLYLSQLTGANFEQMEEDEYDQIYVVTFKKIGKGKFLVLKY